MLNGSLMDKFLKTLLICLIFLTLHGLWLWE